LYVARDPLPKLKESEKWPEESVVVVAASRKVPERSTSICTSTLPRAGTTVPLIVGFFSESILATGSFSLIFESSTVIVTSLLVIASPLPGTPPVVAAKVNVPRSRTGRLAE
jgi:hypothetical protein